MQISSPCGCDVAASVAVCGTETHIESERDGTGASGAGVESSTAIIRLWPLVLCFCFPQQGKILSPTATLAATSAFFDQCACALPYAIVHLVRTRSSPIATPEKRRCRCVSFPRRLQREIVRKLW